MKLHTYMLIYRSEQTDSIITAWIKAYSICEAAYNAGVKREHNGLTYILEEVKIDD